METRHNDFGCGNRFALVGQSRGNFCNIAHDEMMKCVVLSLLNLHEIWSNFIDRLASERDADKAAAFLCNSFCLFSVQH